MIDPRPGLAPPVGLPLGYLVIASAAFVSSALALPGLSRELAGHYYHPRVMALMHGVGLGWVTMTIMGATYQLLPVVLERPAGSTRLAAWQLVAMVAGLGGMLGHFWLGAWTGLAWAAALVGLAVAAHAVNVARGLLALDRWSFTAGCFALALGGLLLAAALGLTLAANRVWGFLPGPVLATVHAHFHLALLGWIAPMVLGVAARVYPMFLLASEPGPVTRWTMLLGLAAGVPSVALGLTLVPALLVPGSLAVVAALSAHGAWVAGVVRDRRRPRLDWGLRCVLAGTVCLLPGMALGLLQALDLVAGPRWGLAYAVLALGGWVSLTVLGMMLKIVPFLVWYRVYGGRAGREPVPTLAELGWTAGEALAASALVLGILGLAAAVLAGSATAIAAAGTVVALGALAFVCVLGRILRHLGRPKASPPATRHLAPGGIPQVTR